jgi:Cu(I)/Ag(I) efflux system membrane protein CusA/SilA
VVGGVVVVRYGENPLAAIKNVKNKIAEISAGLPKKTLPDGTVSQVAVVPFYDRTGLIHETLGTLNTALTEEILVTIIVVLVMVMHLWSSVLISALLPLAVLMCFIAMKVFGVDANIVALSGIAIAIGTMVDMGIIICENILKHLDKADPSENRLEVIFRATSEVGSAVLTAVCTTIVSFLPVFTLEAAEGKLFKPLAFTKTFALIASVVVALTIIPPLAHIFFGGRFSGKRFIRILQILLIPGGLILGLTLSWGAGIIMAFFGLYYLCENLIPERLQRRMPLILTGVCVLIIGLILADHWLPLGPEKWLIINFVFAALLIGGILLFFYIFQRFYGTILRWCLNHKGAFLSVPLFITGLGFWVWMGLGKEFMPPLDEGSYLYMPTTMPHASIGEALDVLQKQDMAFKDIPEVASVVGKLGRAETPLDPAPISMIETVINYYPEYIADKNGKRLAFRYDSDKQDYMRSMDGTPLLAFDGQPYKVQGEFMRDEYGKLIPDPDGMPFRLWRPALDPALNPDRGPWAGINNPDEIWSEIVKAGKIPGTTSAPKLQPIAARIVMLQSGMRAPMGIKIKGPDLETIERFGLRLEQFLKQVPSVEPSAVIADRIVGKPYLEIHIDRHAIARYGIKLAKVQEVIEVAIGGKPITTTVEGRERYQVRIRYMRELRDTIEDLGEILVPASGGAQIPLIQLSDIKYVRGPQVIKSEDTFLIGYVLFDKKADYAEVDVVEQAQEYLQSKIIDGKLQVPSGVSYTFAGSYENQIRAQKRLSVILPLALFIIFIILYFQFKSIPTTMLVFSGIIVAWAGGFIMIWLYGQDWFLNFSLFGTSMRELFQIHPINLSVAIWVGFLALFGIASDNGVVVATYLDQSFEKSRPDSVEKIRRATIEAGLRRVRPCLMTTATTMLALIPVLTSTGRGSDIMVPMAIPSFGGMAISMITIFVVPVLYCAIEEFKIKART